MLDTSTEREWLLEADARQVVNHVQKLRKRAKLQPNVPISVLFLVSGGSSASSGTSAEQSKTGGKKGGKQQSGAKEGRGGDQNANTATAAAELDETLRKFGGFIHQTLLQPLFRCTNDAPLPKDVGVLVSDSFQVYSRLLL